LSLEVSLTPQMMTLTELAQYLRLHECTVRKYAAAGRIPAMRIGRAWRFEKDAIDEWIGGNQTKNRGDKGAQKESIFRKPRK